MTPRPVVTLGALALAAATVLPAPSSVAQQSDDRAAGVTLIKNLSGPLSLAVAPKGAVVVTENFSGKLVALESDRGKPKRVQIGKKGAEVGGVSIAGDRLLLTVTAAQAKVISFNIETGKDKLVANTSKYEGEHNPDGNVTYGFADLDEECAAEFGETPPGYTGVEDSHPYATASAGRTVYIADAGANAILAVRNGTISTVAVLPAVPVTVTEDMAETNGFPDCTVGHDYLLEPVPTDVEVHDGLLYVSSLPGGPEDGSLGPLGSVLVYDPATGEGQGVASGFAGATGLAVAKNGDIYVAEMYGNQISRIRNGSATPEVYAAVKQPAAIEAAKGGLVVSANALSGLDGGPGKAKVIVISR